MPRLPRFDNSLTPTLTSSIHSEIGIPISPSDTDRYGLRRCLKKIDKIAYSFVLGVIYLSESVKSRDFEQYLV